MSARVPFVRVIPEEIGRYGFAGATFVAHIRYRCATDGPGRFMADGVRWWQVSLTQLAAELHVSKDVAQRTMKRLGDAVVAKRFGDPGDQTRAYRLASDDTALTTQNAESHRAYHPERGIAPTPTRNRTDPDAKSRFLPRSGEGEERGRTGPVGAPTPPAALADPDAPPNDHAAPITDASTEPPPRRCPDHIDWDVHRKGPVPGCGACGDYREAHARWKRRHQEAEEDAIAKAAATRKTISDAIEKCPECDAFGRLDDLTDCPNHRNLRQLRVS